MNRLILKCGLAPGDIVMLTAAVRDLHYWYPGKFQTDVRTACPELWEHNPYITPLSESSSGVEQINCSYPLIDESNNLPYHCLHGFIDFLNQRLGLQIKPTAFKGDIHLSDQEKSWYSQVHELTGRDTPFWIITAGGKYDVTVKWWETRRYQQVVDQFRDKILFVQVGEYGHYHPRLDGVIDLRGKTSLRELVRLIYHARGVLCPVTSLMHLAAAVEYPIGDGRNRPCVVVAGGREPAHWEAYPNHQFLQVNGALACSGRGGCWRDRTFPLRDGDKRDDKCNRCTNLAGLLPRCMDLITAEDVIRRIQLYFDGGKLKPLSARHVAAGRMAINARRFNWIDRQPLNLHSAGMACDQFSHSIKPYPGGFQGRGIVICGGGTTHFTNAWVCIHMLRHFGCQLPIELWYLGPKEMDRTMKALVEPLGVECIDATQKRRVFPARRIKGWALKSYAILYSRFRELLFLDADNVPVSSPEYLFDTPQFRETGAIFWPDRPVVTTRKARTIWWSCGLRRPHEAEFESGQMVFDKERCWQPLRLAGWFNENADFYYRYLYGDKETFHLAFRKLKRPYSLIQKSLLDLSGAFCQHDFEGRRLFQHRCGEKWNLAVSNQKIKGFWFETECLEYLTKLRKVWAGSIQPPDEALRWKRGSALLNS